MVPATSGPRGHAAGAAAVATGAGRVGAGCAHWIGPGSARIQGLCRGYAIFASMGPPPEGIASAPCAGKRARAFSANRAIIQNAPRT